jgi:hypothetical protein
MHKCDQIYVSYCVAFLGARNACKQAFGVKCENALLERCST